MPGADTLIQSNHVHHIGFLNSGALSLTCKVLDIIKVVLLTVVVFPQAPFRATNVPRPTLVSSNCATAPWLPEEGRR